MQGWKGRAKLSQSNCVSIVSVFQRHLTSRLWHHLAVNCWNFLFNPLWREWAKHQGLDYCWKCLDQYVVQVIMIFNNFFCHISTSQGFFIPTTEIIMNTTVAYSTLPDKKVISYTVAYITHAQFNKKCPPIHSTSPPFEMTYFVCQEHWGVDIWLTVFATTQWDPQFLRGNLYCANGILCMGHISDRALAQVEGVWFSMSWATAQQEVA